LRAKLPRPESRWLARFVAVQDAPPQSPARKARSATRASGAFSAHMQRKQRIPPKRSRSLGPRGAQLAMVKREQGGKQTWSADSTARGFEPLRAEPNGFLVHHLSHSVTLSCKGTSRQPISNARRQTCDPVDPRWTGLLAFRRGCLGREWAEGEGVSGGADSGKLMENRATGFGRHACNS
jgi:hypothetical protein